jgi:ribonuclease HI
LTTKYRQKTGFTQQTVRSTEQKDEHTIQVFTDGSKNEHGVGAGIAIFIQSKLDHHLRFTLPNRCSNIQAEQPAIVKALETIVTLHISHIIPRTVTVHTDSRITLQSLKNPKKSQIAYRRNQEESNSTRGI